MSEMIERVAEVLWNRYQEKYGQSWGMTNGIMWGPEWGGKKVPWSVVVSKQFTQDTANEYRDNARAAIAAMREPTREMVSHAFMTNGYECGSNWSDNLMEQYRTMIDAALK